jgi:hypothetical protein
LLIGYFEKMADVESAKKRTFQLMNQECRWSRYSPPKARQQKKKKEPSSNRSSKPERAAGRSRDTNDKKQNHSKKPKKGSRYDKSVIADILKLLLSIND